MALPRVTGSRCHCGSHRKPLSLQLGWSRAAELCVPAAQSLQRLQRGYKPHLGMWGVPKPHRGCWNSRLRTSSPKFLLPGAGISRGICCPTKSLRSVPLNSHSPSEPCVPTLRQISCSRDSPGNLDVSSSLDTSSTTNSSDWAIPRAAPCGAC